MSASAREETHIRRMLRTDIEAVISLEHEAGNGISSISRRDLVIMDPGGPLDFSYVCEADGKIVGFVLARLEYLGIPFVPICCINGIALEREYRRQGIGRQLLDSVLDLCYSEGISKARAFVDKDNVDLKNFIEESGFKPGNILNYDIDFEYIRAKPSTQHF